MSSDEETPWVKPTGEWSSRVRFSAVGGFAYRPGEIVVPSARLEEALTKLADRAVQQQEADGSGGAEEAADSPIEEVVDGIQLDDRPGAGHHRVSGVVDELDGIEELRSEGIPVHPNYVLFSHCQCCGCPPGAFGANPFSANPFSANPFSANPFSANPFSAATYQISPHGVPAQPEWPPTATEFRTTGYRPHSANPAAEPDLPAPIDSLPERPEVLVIDTGLADPPPLGLRDAGRNLDGQFQQKSALETWDVDENLRIDPIAGHGTFIAGLVKMIAPHARVLVHGPVSGYGDISEHDLTLVLEKVAERTPPPTIVNLSLGGYAVEDMSELRQAVQDLHDKGIIVVASAGNDATCRPTYPAALPGVISVGALGAYGPAHFTNFGDWVRACAPGVDIVSTFFEDAPTCNGPDRFSGWARWSGTSFAAPAVAGALARVMCEGLGPNAVIDAKSARVAVKRLIDDPGLFRIPGLGAVVNQIPWWRKRAT